MPLAPVTGVNGAAWPNVRVGEGITDVAVTAEFTIRLKLLLAVTPLASVIVTVKLEAACVTVGVPLIAPVDELMLKPVGSEGNTL